jgi:hypothetical protein
MVSHAERMGERRLTKEFYEAVLDGNVNGQPRRMFLDHIVQVL